MKKLLILCSVLFLVSGCGDNTEKLSCTNNSSSNGMTTDIKYDVEYKDDTVKYVTITYDYTDDGTVTDTTTNDTDGVNADTDGNTENSDNESASDNVVDGALGDAIDGATSAVTDAILDISGIKTTYENQFSTYEDIKGFSYDVKVDDEDEYKVVYKIDMDEISDSDLATFNLDRSLKTLRSNYEDSGYTCD